ncbi:MAG: hypothetical protein KDD43_06890, partial [Bdellovibrionales bacterium]|nr:hypothetical protein [Bdellovibrionales bacterium]
DHLILKGLIGQTITRVQVEALPISEDCKVYFPCIVIHLNGGGKLYYMDIDEDLGFFYLNEEDVPREPEDLMPRDEHLYNVTEIDQISDFGLSQ